MNVNKVFLTAAQANLGIRLQECYSLIERMDSILMTAKQAATPSGIGVSDIKAAIQKLKDSAISMKYALMEMDGVKNVQ